MCKVGRYTLIKAIVNLKVTEMVHAREVEDAGGQLIEEAALE